MSGIDISQYNKSRSEFRKAEIKKPGSFKALAEALNKDINLFGKRLNDKRKERFYAELSILLSAGVDIKTALELVAVQQNKNKFKELFTSIKDKVIGGENLSFALQSSGYFTAYEYYSLRIGEESGKISEVLNELTKFYEGKIKQKRQVVSALSYPIVITLTAFGAIFFMLRFVIPLFADVFKRFKTDLPPLTKLIIHISDVLSHYFLIFLLFLIFFTAFIYVQRNKEWFRKVSSSIILKIPFIGDLVRKIYLARFCHAMNLLVSAKTPLINSLELVKKMVGFYPIENSLEGINKMILDGEPFYQGLSKYNIYTTRMVSLVKVAEEVNRLEIIFEKLSKQFTDEVEHQTSIISSLLEPVIIIFLGLLVAIILVSMYLPLFKLSTSIGM